MTTLAIERVTSLPTPLKANTLYMVADVNNTNVHFVATGKTATVKYRTYNEADIGTFITNALAAQSGGKGTVTSVDVGVPTGLKVSSLPVTSAGIITIGYDVDYAIPRVSRQGFWDSAYSWGDHALAGYYASGKPLGTPASGNLSNCTVDGTSKIGYRNIPQNAQSVAYTCVLADEGKHIYQTTGGSITIPANASVAFSIGAAITIVNAATAITIAITTDTMRLAGNGATGTRTLAAYGVATAIKITATEWRISGSGLS